MKLLNKVIFFLSLLYFSRVNAQDVSINILNQPASLNVGSTNGQVTVDICNNDGGTNSAPLSKVRPLITIPSSLIGTSLVSISNVGWQVLSNNGSTIMFENTSTIASGECSQIILGYTAINPGGPLTITGTIGFNGSQTVGNLSGNDNSTTSITVLNDTDKDTIVDVNDIDDDNDGILDIVEYQACGIGGTAACDTDGDGIPNHLDLDSDNDGINDVNEAGSTLADIDGNGQADGVIQSNGAISSPVSIYSSLPNPNADSLANPYDLDSDNDGLLDLIEGGLANSLDANADGLVDCSSNCDSDNDGILTPVDSIPNIWGDDLLLDLSPTIEIASLSFSEAGAKKDFIIKIFEINNVTNLVVKPIAFRVAKSSAFDITYTTTSGISNVFTAIDNNNGDWTFTETANFIKVTSNTGITIPAGGARIMGFTATRKLGIPQNTSQNITVTIIYGSAGEEKVDNNIVETKITAN